MNVKTTMTIIIALVAMVGLTGLVSAGTTTTYTGDGSYDMTYTGIGGGNFTAVTHTSVGYDHITIDYDADMSGEQSMGTNNGWTEIDREARTDDGYGLISTYSQDTIGIVNFVGTSVGSDNHAKLINQNVEIAAYGVGVVSYQAAADDGVMGAGAYGGTIIGGTYMTSVSLEADDHSVLYTDATAEWGLSDLEFDTNEDDRNLLYGGVSGDGKLVVVTDTTANFGQDLTGTYDATTVTVDIGGSNGGYTSTAIVFGDTCDVTGSAGTSYWYGFPVAP